MWLLRLLLQYLIDPGEFMYQRRRRKYHGAIARGDDPKFPAQFVGDAGVIRVDPLDIIASPKVQKQVAMVKRLERQMR